MQSKDTFPMEIGKVFIELDKSIYLRLRWTIGTNRYVIGFGRNSVETLKIAIATAQILDSDLTFDRDRYPTKLK